MSETPTSPACPNCGKPMTCTDGMMRADMTAMVEWKCEFCSSPERMVEKMLRPSHA